MEGNANVEYKTFLNLVSRCMNLYESNKNPIDDLTESEVKTLLFGLDFSYHVIGKSLVPDIVFDELLRDASNRYSNILLYSNQCLNKVVIPVEMPSLKKIYNTEEDKLERQQEFMKIVLVSSKLDGVSCLLDKKKDKISLYTKGTGKIGKNISHLRDHINIDFSTLPEKCILRGELIFKKDTNSDGKALRSKVIGVVNSNVETPVPEGLELICYEVIKPEGLPYNKQFNFLTEKKIKTPLYRIYSSDVIRRPNLEALYREFILTEEYEIDGLVIAETSFYFGNSIRNSYCFAFKHNTLFASTTVVGIDWIESRKSIVIPVIVFEPVILNNSVIKRATGYNARYVIDNKIGIGAEIEITLSGNSISKIVRVITPSDEIILPENGYMTDVHYKLNTANAIVIAKQIEKYFEVFEISGIRLKSILSVMAYYEQRKIEIKDIFTFVRLIKNWQITSKGLTLLGPVKDKTLFEAVRKLTSKRVYFNTICVASGLFDLFGLNKSSTVLNQCPLILEYIKSRVNTEEEASYSDAETIYKEDSSDTSDTSDSTDSDDSMDIDNIKVEIDEDSEPIDIEVDVKIEECEDEEDEEIQAIKNQLFTVKNIGESSVRAFISGLKAYVKDKSKFDNTFNINYDTEKEIVSKKINVCFSNVKEMNKYLVTYNDLIVLKLNITKQTDYLVVPSLETNSGKVTKAKQYGVKIITLSDFHKLMRSMSVV